MANANLSVLQCVLAKTHTSSDSLLYCKHTAVSTDPDVYVTIITQSSAEELAA